MHLEKKRRKCPYGNIPLLPRYFQKVSDEGQQVKCENIKNNSSSAEKL